MARTTGKSGFKMKSGNGPLKFKNMGSSPVQRNIFSDRPGYKEKVAEKRAKFRSDVGEFLGGLQKAGKDIKSKVDKAAMYISSDAVKARRKTSLANKNKIKKQKAIDTYNAKEKIRTDAETKTFRAKQAAETVKYRKDLAVKVSNKEKGIGPKQVNKGKKFKKINTKLTTTDLTGTTISGKKVNKNKMAVNNKPTPKMAVSEPTPPKKAKVKKTKAKRKAGESQFQANVRVSRENSAKMRKIAKSLAANIKNKSNNGKEVDLTRKKGLGPRP